jgi:hypothetical protein
MAMRSKNLIRWYILIGMVAFAMLVPAPAATQSKVGTTAAQFLGISVGPRAIAMGSAYVAEAQDVTSLYWNPGAAPLANKSEFVFSNSEWLVGTKFRWFGFMYNVDGENLVGLSLTQLDYGEDDVTTVANPEGTGERWSAKDLCIGLSYSRRLTDRFAMGLTAKYVSQSIWNETASSFGFDVGLLYVTGFHGMRLGASLSNFGADMKLDGSDLLTPVDIDPQNTGGNKNLVASLKTESWPMPLLFRIGLAMDVVQTDEFKVTVAADALRPTDNQESLNIGGEVGWRNLLFLRGGYKSILRVGSKPLSTDETQETLSLGAGLRYHAEGIATLEVNYAFTKFGLFGNLNTIGLAISF